MSVAVQALGEDREERGPARRADRRRGVVRRPGRDHCHCSSKRRPSNRRRESNPTIALRLAGRDVYVREGCYLCHSQMIRALRFETQRYGEYSVLGDSVYDRPFQWGSKRTGPDLARIGGKYSDAWQRLHLIAPRTLVPESNMPNYGWLAKAADRRRRCAGAYAGAASARGSVQRCRDRSGTGGGQGQDRARCDRRLSAGSGRASGSLLPVAQATP